MPAPGPSLCRRLWQDGGLISRRLFIDSRQMRTRGPGGPRQPGAGREALPHTARPAPAVPRECGGRSRPATVPALPSEGKGLPAPAPAPRRWEHRKAPMPRQCRNSFQIQGRYVSIHARTRGQIKQEALAWLAAAMKCAGRGQAGRAFYGCL